jgi:hypothetical protein
MTAVLCGNLRAEIVGSPGITPVSRAAPRPARPGFLLFSVSVFPTGNIEIW